MATNRASPLPAIQIQPAYTVDQFSDAFGVGRSKIYVEIGAGRLRTFKVGGRTLIASEDTIAWRDYCRSWKTAS